MAVVAGQTITAQLLDRLEDPPIAVLQQTVTQSVANGAWAVMTFDTEITDSYSGHSLVTNTSRYTCQLAGWYRVTVRAAFAANATGSRGARIHKNGAFIQGAANLCGAGTLNGIVEASHILLLAAGDYVEGAAGQNSGGALSTSYANESACMLYVQRIHT
nr:hypothetical protein OG409_08005 [Streptomyces sp. NBC_00974]